MDMNTPGRLDPVVSLDAGSYAERRTAPRVVVWYPRMASAGYSGPNSNFLRLFSSGSDKLQFTLLTASDSTGPLPPGMVLHHVGRRDGALRKHEQLLLIASVTRWLIVHRNSFDVFYGLSAFHYSVAPAFVAHLLGRKAVVRPAGRYDYDPQPATPSGRLAMRLKRAMLRRLDGVVAINSEIRDWFVSFGFPVKRVCFAPNSVDLGRFSPAAQVPSGDLTVVHVGGWTARKRLHSLVEAVRMARDQGVAARIISAGPKDDPDYAAQVESMLADYGLEDRFTWMGQVQSVEDVYRAGHVFCLPSAAEGMPNALLEAMACGLPAIVTILAGTADVVRDGIDGYLLPQPSDEADLARDMAVCIVRYARAPELRARHAAAAHERIRRDFNKDAVKFKIENFLARIDED